jgi:alanine racemase
MHEARIDLAAVHHNARVLLRRRGTSDVADLRADAYGHGVLEIARVVTQAGFPAVLVSNDRDRRILLHGGISDRVIRLPGTVEAGATIVGPELFGVAEDRSPELGLAVAMRVSGRVISVRTVDEGEGVSYGLTYRLRVRSTLALVPIGYGEGLHRSATNRGRVRLSGGLRTIAGRVAMNAHVLDLGGDRASVGDEAVLFGDDGSGLDAFAESIGQHAAEIVTGFGMSMRRVYA